jgi:hypothetical protein
MTASETARASGLWGRAWLATLPEELSAQRAVLTAMIEFCEQTPAVSSYVVGCSLGRGAADALSDIDSALGVDAPRGDEGAERLLTIEAAIVARLPEFGELVEVLRHRYGPRDRLIRRIFAQFADGAQLDVTIMAEAEIRRGQEAPDWVPLYSAVDIEEPSPQESPAADETAPQHGFGYDVSADELREWAFLGWNALIDLDKYLRRGSVWEAHNRLHEARDRIWALWGAATGALYPRFGLSQVLDRDPHDLPLGMEATVATLDAAELRRAARAAAELLTEVSARAAARVPEVELPEAMAAYVTDALARHGNGTLT